MKPWLSQTKGTFVPKPPRERPSACSDGPWSCASLRPPSRRGPVAFFFRPRGGSARADDGAIDTPQVVIDEALVVQFVQQRGDDTNPGAVLAPRVEAVEHGLPRSVAFGEITPRGASVQDPEDTVDDDVLIVCRSPKFAVMGRVRKQGGNPSPLLIRELVATRDWPPFGNHSPLMDDPPIFYSLDPLRNQFSDRA